MAIETIGKFQVHLDAVPVRGGLKYAPYVTIARFDEEAGDFRVVVDRTRAPGEDVFDTQEEAEEVARRHANHLIRDGALPGLDRSGG